MTTRVFFSAFHPLTTGVEGSAVSSASKKSIEDIIKNLNDISLVRLEEVREDYNTKIIESEGRFNDLIDLIDPASGTPGRRILDLEIKTDDSIGRLESLEANVGTADGQGDLFGRIAGLELITTGDTFVRTEVFEELQTVATQKARTFVQSNPPSGSPDGIGLTPGDLWIDSNDNNKLYRYDGTIWVDVTPAGSTLKTFAQPDAPTEGMQTGDIWFDTDNNNKQYRYNGSEWINVQTSGITTYAQDTEPTGGTYIDGDLWVETDNNNSLHRYNGTNWVSVQPVSTQTFAQDEPPTQANLGDLWFDTNNNNRMYRYNGSTWVATDDARIGALENTVFNHTDLIADLESGKASTTIVNQVKSIAELKNRVFAQDSAPVSPVNGVSLIYGDAWIDTDDSNKLYIWKGSGLGWVLSSDDRALAELTAARDGYLNLSAKLGGMEITFNNALDGKAGATKYDYLEAEIRTAAGGAGKVLNERLNSVDINVNGSAAATRVGNLELSVEGNPNAPAGSPERKGVKARLTTTEQVATAANGKAFSTYGVVQDVNGYATGFQLANNGTSGSFKIRADKLEVASPTSTGARTEYSGNSWKVYGPNGVLRVEMGVFA